MRVDDLKQELDDRFQKMISEPLNKEYGFENCPDTSLVAIDKARAFIHRWLDEMPDFDRPATFPNEDGSIGLQWHLGYDCLMVDVGVNGELKNVWWSKHGDDNSTFRIGMRRIMKEIFG